MHSISHVNAEDVVEVDHVVPRLAVSLEGSWGTDFDVLAILGQDGNGLSVDELRDSVRVRRSLPPFVVMLLDCTVKVPKSLASELPDGIVANETSEHTCTCNVEWGE